MAVFSVWNRKRLLHQVAWVCGPEPVLRREVVAAYVSGLPGISKSVWWFGEHEESQIWDYLLTPPPAGGRLVIVQAAEKAKLTERFALLIQNLMPLSYVVFTSSDDDFPYIEPKAGKRPAGQKTRIYNATSRQLSPHLAVIQADKDGQLIRCCRPSKDEELLKLIASWWPRSGANWAARVWERCGGDLTATWQACDTARRASLASNIEEHLDMACQHVPGAAFADSLISGQITEALQEAQVLGPHEALSAVALLNSRLSQVRLYAACSSRGMTTDEIARRGLSRYQQHLLAPYAARYSPGRELGCRRLLARAEDTLRSGVRTGVLEAVAALWG
jgi:hypothetical protein